MAVVFKGHRR